MCRDLTGEGFFRLRMNMSYWYGSFLFLLTWLGSFSIASAQVSVTFDTTDPLCAGLPQGTITANPSGGTAPYTYEWSNGEITRTIRELKAGKYRLTVTDDRGRKVRATATLTDPDPVVVAFETETCEAPYKIKAIAGGGTAPYSYRWDTGDTGSEIMVAGPGQYCVTVTDANLCGRLACVTVESNPPSIQVEADDITCPGADNGSLTATVTGGQAPFTFNWSNGKTGQQINNLSSGNYTVTVIDANGCTDVGFGSVDEPDDLSLNLQAVNPDCLGDNDGALTAFAGGGTAPYTYLWSTGQTTQSITGLAPGTYRVTVTDANGCPITGEETIQNRSNLQVVTSSSDESCTDEDDGVAIAEGINGLPPYSYLWSNGATTSVNGDLAPGTYFVTVTDAAGCRQIGFEVIAEAVEVDFDLEVEDISTCDATDGSASVTINSGVNPFIVEWSTGASGLNVNGLGAGTYSVTVTDANDCFVTREFTIIEPPAVTVGIDASDFVCEGTADGVAEAFVAGGTAPFTYQWSTGASTKEIQNLPAGVYTVTVTDAKGCTAIDEVLIPENTAPVVQITATALVCGGQNIGSATAEVVSGGTAPFTFEWSDNSEGASIDELGTGLYTVTVTDANGCEGTASVTITINSAINLTINKEDSPCEGEDNGTATVEVEGGTAPYTYLWNNGNETNTISQLAPGTYTVTVTDANDCEAVEMVTITEPTALELSFEATGTVCEGEKDGIITAIVEGGTPPYRYNWNNGEMTRRILDLPAGRYVVTVTDANDCTIQGNVTIQESPNLNAVVRATAFVCGGLNNGRVEVDILGGQPPFDYQWSTGATGVDRLENLGTGDYTVTVIDANGCFIEATGRVTVVEEISVLGQTTDVDCFGAATGSIDLVINGGIPPFQYQWNTGSRDSSLTGLPAGTYRVQVTDSTGCTAEASFEIMQPAPLSVDLSATDLECSQPQTGSCEASVSGGTPPFNFEWSNNDRTANITNLDPGTYSVTVTDDNGCTVVQSIDVNDPGTPSCLIQVTKTITNPNAMDGAAQVLTTGGVPPYSYAWSTGESSPEIENLGPVAYTATVTDANGCETSCEVNLGEFVENAIIGDFVWFDLNMNGRQDPGELGVPGITVVVTPVTGGGRISEDTTVTDSEGLYLFEVAPGDYKITFLLPDSLRLTTRDAAVANDETDSDADPVMFMTDVFNIEAGEVDLSFDAGVIPAPDMLLEEECVCLNNATEAGNGQFEDVLEVSSMPGENWEVIAATGAFLASSPAPPAAPAPITPGTSMSEGAGGIYTLSIRHVDGQGYTISVSNGMDTMTVSNSCAYPTIAVINLEEISKLCVNSQPVVPEISSSVIGNVIFFLNGEEVDEIDPTALGLGMHELVIRLEPFDDEECEPVIRIPIEVTTENCPAKLGDYVWLDLDEDGIQDENEPGIEGVKATLSKKEGNNFVEVDQAFTDATGMYMFQVMPGDYKVTFMPPANRYFPTIKDAGNNDAVDSDMDPGTRMTPVYTIEGGGEDLTIDAGFYVICVNITDPGEIGYDQMLCGPGNDPEPIVSIRDASGGEGELEYLWMKSEVAGPFDESYFEPIPNSNTPTYDPGPVYKTTYFARCARRKGCPYLETKIVTVQVKDDAQANIISKSSYCYTEPATFTVETKTDNSSVEWEFTGGIIPKKAQGRTVTVNFTSFGIFEAKVTVKENGCTASTIRPIVVTYNPTYCGQVNLEVQADVIAEQQDVMLKWKILNDGLDYGFDVEHSADGTSFEKIAEVKVPFSVNAGFKYYEYLDEVPKRGRNVYRVKMTNPDGGVGFSEPLQLMLFDDNQSLMIYPNPVQDRLMVEFIEIPDQRIQLELINASGSTVNVLQLEPETLQKDLDFSNYAEGLYFLRITIGEKTETLKVFKRNR